LQAPAKIVHKSVLTHLHCLQAQLPQDIAGLIHGSRRPQVVSLAGNSGEHRRKEPTFRANGNGSAQVSQYTVNPYGDDRGFDPTEVASELG